MIDEPDGSELEQWAEDGKRLELTHRNTVSYVSPDERFRLTVVVDDPVEGYLIELYHTPTEALLARFIDDDRASASAHAAGIADAAEQYLPLVEATG